MDCVPGCPTTYDQLTQKVNQLEKIQKFNRALIGQVFIYLQRQ